MFEFTVARKYLLPRWRQLSVSIITLISSLVIALVVWLLVVFFSVTHGLERGWIDKLTALTAPVRVVPTEAYYNSYYYRIDSISSLSNYSLKTIGEKLAADHGNPYNPDVDEEAPANWNAGDYTADGALKDLVKEAFASINALPGVTSHDYEVTASNLKLRLLRHQGPFPTQAFMNQATYLGSLDPSNQALKKTLLTPSAEDLENLFNMAAIGPDNLQEDFSETFAYLKPEDMQPKLAAFFEGVELKALRTPKEGWRLPRAHFPETGSIKGLGYYTEDGTLDHVVIPQDSKTLAAASPGTKVVVIDFAKPYDANIPLILEGNVVLNASLQKESIAQALRPREVAFTLDYIIQGQKMGGVAPLANLHFDKATLKNPHWLHTSGTLPRDAIFGEGILLPKTFREATVRLGDRGYLSFYTPTASSVQEQRQPVYVAGFYDPGIIPIGGKFVIANEDMIALIRSSHEQDEASTTNGINVRFDDLKRADSVKAAIEKSLAAKGIDKYWTVQTYREYDFTKPLLNQLQSDKTLLSLISLIIILVACSNIISMLIILVNDKKLEIGIMRAMGATSRSIATIFGLCGMIMGMLGSLIGTFAAIYTLNHIDTLVYLLSKFQGHAAFNPMFYGENLPNQLSYEALAFIILLTGGISLLAGVVPAVKASMMRPSEILRSE